MRLCVAAIALAGCWSSPAPRPPVSSVAPKAAPITSCAIEPVRTPVELRHLTWLGRIGDRSWLIAERGAGAVLVGYDGRLREVLLGEGTPFATAVDGAKLWLAVPRGQRIELRAVDLAAASPAWVASGSLATQYVRGIAVGATRALADVSGPGLQFQLFDRSSGAPVGRLVELKSTGLDPANLMCSGDRCTALAVEGDGPTRRIFVERFAPDGRTEHEVLAGDHVMSYKLAVVGGRRFAMWTAFNEPGIFARELDAVGRPRGERVRLVADKGLDFEVLPDPEAPRIAHRRADGWTLAVFDPGAVRLGPAVATGLPRESYFLLGATLYGGALLVGFTSNVDYRHGFHSWSGKVFGAFAPAGTAVDPSVALASTGGDGRGGIAGFPLVAPGHAAVIVLPQGPESDTHGGELVELRKPCR